MADAAATDGSLPSLLDGAPLTGLDAGGGAISSLSPGRENELLVTVAGKGIQLVNANDRTILSSWMLQAKSATELRGAAALNPSSGTVAAPVRPAKAGSTKPDRLAVWPANSPSGRLDAFPSVELRGHVAAVHPAGADGGFVALCADGSCSHVMSAGGAAGGLAAADIEGLDGEEEEEEEKDGKQLRHLCSAPLPGARGGALQVLALPGNRGFRLRTVTAAASGSGPGLRTLPWAVPSPASKSARPTAVAAVGATRAVLLWSDATLQVLEMASGAVAVQQQLAAMAPKSLDAVEPGSAKKPKSKKRQASEPAQEPAAGLVASLCSLSERQVAVAGPAAVGSTASGRPQVLLAVLDAAFGCVLSLRRAPSSVSPAGPLCLSTVSAGGSGAAYKRTVAISGGSGVFLADLEAAPVSLADAVGSLAAGSPEPQLLFGAAQMDALTSGLRLSHAAPSWSASASKAGDKGPLEGAAAAALWDASAMDGPEEIEKAVLGALSGGALLRSEEQLLAVLKPILTSSHAASTTVRAAATRAVVAGSHWKLLRKLLKKQPLDSLRPVPELPKALLESHKYEMLASVLARATDLLPQQMSDIITAVLGSSGRSDEARKGMRLHAAKLKERAEAHLDLAEGCTADDKRAILVGTATAAVMFVDKFTDAEICLHLLMGAEHTSLSIREAVGAMDGAVVNFLLSYLCKWLKKLLRCPRISSASRRALPFGMEPPTLAQILHWVTLTVDCHIMHLIHQADSRQVLAELSVLVEREARSLRSLMLLEGASKQLISQPSALPSAKTMARKLYSIELLDTHVA